MGRDQGVWATAGMAINKGAVFFKDYLHFNLPGLGFSYAVALKFTDDPRTATMLLSLAGSILLIISMYLLMQQTVNKAAAAWSVLLFSVMWPTYIDFWSFAQKDFMAMYGVLSGTWLMARADQQTSWRRLSTYTAGIAVGIAVMYKPLFAITGILLAALQTAKFVWQPADAGNNRKQWQALFCDLLLLLSGAMTVALLFLLYLVIGDALEGLRNGLFVLAPAYSRVYSQSVLRQIIVLIAKSAIRAAPLDWSALPHYLIWMLISFTGFATMVKYSYVKEKAWLSVPFLTALFTYFIQRKAFSYHTIPWQICIFIVAGCGLAWAWDCIWSCSRESGASKRTIFALLLLLTVGILFARALFLTNYAKAEVPAWLNLISREEYLNTHFAKVVPGVPSQRSSETLAEWVKQNSLPEDKILVWGLECQLYVLADRMYATHSPFDVMLTIDVSHNKKAAVWQKTIRQQFIQQLESDSPKFIIIVNNDANPIETVPSNEAIAFIPGFQTLIDNQYQKIKSIELFDVYQRNS